MAPVEHDVGFVRVHRQDGAGEREAAVHFRVRVGDRAEPGQACSPLGVLEFRGLEEASGAYRIEIADARFAAESVAFELGTSAYLGTIRLRPR